MSVWVCWLYIARGYSCYAWPTRVRRASDGLQSGWFKKHMNFLNWERYGGGVMLVVAGYA